MRHPEKIEINAIRPLAGEGGAAPAKIRWADGDPGRASGQARPGGSPRGYGDRTWGGERLARRRSGGQARRPRRLGEGRRGSAGLDNKRPCEVPSVSLSTSTYCSEASAPPSSVSGQGSNLRPEDLHGMQWKFRWCDSLLAYPTLVGHIHLNKYLDSTSLLGRLLVICDLFFYCTIE
jgi:hypothetical protein